MSIVPTTLSVASTDVLTHAISEVNYITSLRDVFISRYIVQDFMKARLCRYKTHSEKVNRCVGF